MDTKLPHHHDKKTIIRKGIKYFWFTFLAVILFVVLIFVLTAYGVLGEMPKVKDLDSPDIYVASEIYSQDGVILGKYELEKRIPLEYKDLPPSLVQALLAKEDVRFTEHSGIDAKRTLGAISTLGSSGGGSTISQQLAKLLFTENRSSNKIVRSFQKVKEMIVAVQLEKRYTKNEIIAMYFNKFDFLYNANGIETASQVYFSKSAKDLTVPESALFVAMLQNPVKHNPKKDSVVAKEKRDGVINMMANHHLISPQDARKYKAEPINLKYSPIKEVGEDYSEYFKFYLKGEINTILKNYEKETGKQYNLYKDGLKIYVNLDSRMQKYGQEALTDHLKQLQRSFDAIQRGNPNAPYYKISKERANELFIKAMKRTGRYKSLKAEGKSEAQIYAEFQKPIRLDIFTWKGKVDTLMSPWDSIRYHKQIIQGGLMSMEPATGQIKAWVGGIDWNFYQYDHVKQARRQVGSTFKPFVYATAIKDLGYTPCTAISSGPFSIGGWHPRNADGRYGGAVALKQALPRSINTVSARLISQTGVKPVIQLCRELGVESPIPENYTISLGSCELSLWEMVGAYSAFANFGNYIKPEVLWRIEDSNGKLIYESQPEFKEVIHEIYAYTMIDIMKGTVDFGTAKKIRGYGIKAQIAGKTGTTNDNSDGWFIGIVPKLATGVWVGWEDRFAHFPNAPGGAGSFYAIPIWGNYMKKVYANPKLGISQDDKFPRPVEIDENWDCESLKGYGGEGGLSLDDIINGEEYVDTSAPMVRDENVNQKLNKDDTIDYNK